MILTSNNLENHDFSLAKSDELFPKAKIDSLGCLGISFEKFSGCGNDFIIIDNRDRLFLKRIPASLVKVWCNRRLGIGADGIILLEKSLNADFCMRIFNADGTEAEMCGNGLRCLAHYIKLKCLFSKEMIQSFTIETLLTRVLVEIRESKVSVHMPSPKDLHLSISLSIDKVPHLLHFIDTGVPHVVEFVKDIEEDDLMKYAKKIRMHEQFFPSGVNVNFASIQKDRTILMRTYERGVESETLACGTGAVAVAMIAANIHHTKSPVTVITRSQDSINITFDDTFENVIMSGPSVKIYEGEIKFNPSCLILLEEKSLISIH